MGEANTSASGPRRERSSSLRVYLLGRFQVERDGSPIPADAWRRRRPAELLKLLALAPGRALGRDAAVAALWPGMPPAQGANNLHRALYDLRQALGARWVHLEGGELRLREDAWIDVDAFEAGARSADRAEQERALSLYEGDLSALEGSPPWAEERREALRERFVSASLEVARALVDGGAHERAIAILGRAVGSGERGGHEAHVLLVRLLATSGRRAEALRHLDRHAARLRSTGGGSGDALEALRDAILSGELAPVATGRPDGYVRAARRLLGTSAPPPVRGREATSPLLRALVEAGWGSVVLLGEQGVGKTRLAIEGARLAQDAGAVVLAGALDPTRPQPCLPFAEMFEEHRRAGEPRADPFSIPEGWANDKPTLYRRVQEALRAIGAGRPLYLLVDELEHADESSANLFHHLARSAQELRLMLVATCREEAVRAGAPVQMLLAHLAAEQLSRGVRLPRLGLRGSTDLVGDLLGREPAAELAMLLYRLTDGRPHFLEALARAYRESGNVPDDPAAAVREVLERLRPDTVRLLEAAAVAGRSFDLAVARAASGLGGRELVEALREAVAAGLLSFDGEHHHVRGALVRDALYARIPDAERAALHGAVADALSARAAASDAASGAISDALAHHRRLAGDAPRAFAHLVEAGRRAAARAGLGEAKAFYTAALELAGAAGAPPAQVCELLALLGEIALALAELPDAGRAFEAAARLEGTGPGGPAPEAIARARHGAALALVVGGRLEEAERELQHLVAERGLEPGARRAQAHLLLARIPLHDGRFTEALERARLAVEEAELAGDRALAVLGRDVESLAAGARGAPARPPWPLPIHVRETPFDTRLVLFELDLLGDRTVAELEALARAWGEVVRSRDVPTQLALPDAMRGAIAARAARRGEALPALRAAARLFEVTGDALGLTFALEREAALLTAGGRLEQAMRLLGGAIVAAEQAALRRHALTRAHAALVRNRLAAGDLDAAEDVAGEAGEYAARHGACVVCQAQLLPELTRLALARGRLAQADDHAAELDGLAARRGGRGLRAIAREVRGRVLAAHGAHAEAAVAFCDAADLFEAAGAALRAAEGRELATRALREAGGADRLAQAEALALRASAVLAPLRAADGA